MRLPSVLLLLAASCAIPQIPEDTGAGPSATPNATALQAPDAPPAMADFEAAPTASERLPGATVALDLRGRADAFFDRHLTHRMYVQLDRPLYRPGDTVWLKSWDLSAQDLTPLEYANAKYELINPAGLTVATYRAAEDQGAGSGFFDLTASAPGGKWTVRATGESGAVDERPFVVSSYQAPRIKKTLDFVREAYGAGDQAEALVELTRASGEPLANHDVDVLLQVDGEVVVEATLRTDDTGAVFVRAALPDDLTSGDGLLTVLVDDGGVTESISRSVPILLADAQLAFFPEGGDLVQDLPGRVYLEATNAHGEPADVSGEIVDDTGAVVATFSTVHDGLGRVAFTPARGRLYHARVTAPADIDTAFALPEAMPHGCVLRSFDDVHSDEATTRVAVRCDRPQDVIVAGVLRDQTEDIAQVTAGPDEDAVVALAVDEERVNKQGAMRVTVFDQDLNPLAERLVYRNPGRDLDVTLTADRDQYGPRDEVVLTVHTADPDGRPMQANLALSVVDDAVLGLADDEEGNVLTRLYLEPELIDSPDDPAWYFDAEEPNAARGLDLVMGTRGYRRFDWDDVWNPAPLPEPTAVTRGLGRRDLRGMGGMGAVAAEMAPIEQAPQRDAVGVPSPPPVLGARRDEESVLKGEASDAPRMGRSPGIAQRAHRLVVDDDRATGRAFGGLIAMDDVALNNGGARNGPRRVFPKPDYHGGFHGERTDFRDTVYWEPSVQTDDNGDAEVRFYLSDAITTFRVTAEGVGHSAIGVAGRAEQTLTSTLPVSMSTTLPVAVSAGDRLDLPVTVTSTRGDALQTHVTADFGSPLLHADTTTGDLTLPADGTDTVWFPVTVGEGAGVAHLSLTASGGGLSDAVTRDLTIVPPGFPRNWSAAGESQANTPLTVHVDEWVPGSLHASVTWHPSTVATLLSGMEGLIRTPGGCFEQTSSTNWPNVAILKYLDAHDGDPRVRLASGRALDVGYTKLTGYQIDAGGFETFGSGPGKEVLSAFGLLQFADMAAIYPVDDAMMARDVAYLRASRDGHGGYTNSGESSHGYGNAPAPVLNGFITWALVATGHSDGLTAEIAAQADVARTTSDPYVLALAARTLVAVGHDGAERAISRLAGLQADDGSFPGAASSITRSYEANLLVESTALAALAMMDADAKGLTPHRPQSAKAAEWLVAHRRGAGTWGATQATALALSTLTAQAEIGKRPQTAGRLIVEVNGRQVGTLPYAADQTEPLVIDGWADALTTGDNTVVLRQASGDPLPFTVDVGWTSITPDSAEGAELSVATRLSDTSVSMGDTVRLTATIDNLTDRVVPSPIARIGLPAGLTPQTWQLTQLQERGEIAFFETRPREVTLYWEGVHAGDAHEVNLDLVATVPGAFTGPASSAYPYYNDDEKAWDAGLTVTISRR